MLPADFQVGDCLVFKNNGFSWTHPIRDITQRLILCEDRDTDKVHAAWVGYGTAHNQDILGIWTTGASGFNYGWVPFDPYLTGRSYIVCRPSTVNLSHVHVMQEIAEAMDGQFYGFLKVGMLMAAGSRGGVVQAIHTDPHIELTTPFCSEAVMNIYWKAGLTYYKGIKLEPSAFAPSTIEKAARDKDVPTFNVVGEMDSKGT